MTDTKHGLNGSTELLAKAMRKVFDEAHEPVVAMLVDVEEKLEKKIDGIDGKVDGLKGQMDGVQDKVSGMSKKLDKFQDQRASK